MPEPAHSLQALPLQPRARVMLCAKEGAPSAAAGDGVCEQLQQRGTSFALLQVHAALISNINVRENLLLMSTWSTAQDAAQSMAQLSDLVAGWELSHDLVDRLLLRRPAQLTDSELRLAVLLRAALVQPQVLVLLPDWFGHPPTDDDPWWLLQRQHFAHCAWCFICDQKGVEPVSENWQRIIFQPVNSPP